MSTGISDALDSDNELPTDPPVVAHRVNQSESKQQLGGIKPQQPLAIEMPSAPLPNSVNDEGLMQNSDEIPDFRPSS